MRIYLAGKWEEHKKLRRYMDRIEKAGHTITCDWTVHDSVYMDEHGKIDAAIRDMDGVLACDLLIFIAETEGLIYRGSLVEMGAALAQGKEAWVVGNGIDNCLFINLPMVTKFESFKLVMERLDWPEGVPRTITCTEALMISEGMYDPRWSSPDSRDRFGRIIRKGGESGRVHSRSLDRPRSKVLKER